MCDHQDRRDINRRSFLRTSAGAAAGSAKKAPGTAWPAKPGASPPREGPPASARVRAPRRQA